MNRFCRRQQPKTSSAATAVEVNRPEIFFFFFLNFDTAIDQMARPGTYQFSLVFKLSQVSGLFPHGLGQKIDLEPSGPRFHFHQQH